MPIALLQAPAQEPVSVLDAKAHMRVEIADDDALIAGLLAAAREHVEDVTGRKLITQKWQLVMDRFTEEEMAYVFFNRLFVPSVFDIAANHLTPDRTRVIHIPYAPVASIDSFTVVDANGNSQVFDPSNFVEDLVGEPARIVLKEASDWPYPAADLQTANAVQIDFTVGYGADGTFVPARLLLAIKMLTAHWYENREDSSPLHVQEIPMGVKSLIAPFRLMARGQHA